MQQDKVALDKALLRWKAQKMRLKGWSYDSQVEQVALEKSNGPHWCSPSEYLDGEWLMREEEVTLENIREIYKYEDLGQLKCRAVDEPRGVEPDPEDPAAWARIFETAQYVWVPKSGSVDLYAQGSSELIFPSSHCYSVVGDSLADQIYTATWSSMIAKKDSLFELHASPERIFNITVNRNHPDAQRLAEAAGVTMERLDRPIFNYWREHHLVNREDLDEAFVGCEGYEKWVGGASQEESMWIWDRSWWYELWNSLLDQAIEFVPRSKDGLVPIEENSVISFSTGPHWTPVELWPQHAAARVTDEELFHGYTTAANRVIQNVTAAAQEHKVLAWWRSSTAAHPQCTQYSQPESDRTTHHSTLHPTAKEFNWDQFAVFDNHVATKLEQEPDAAMQFMNLWPLSVTRPDAHLKPSTDCMHFCNPGVPNEWLEFMWHSMVLGAENDDYDELP
ncbi:hypothetical protein QFC19_003537 [Naganishia cerealis]|uniref:Uncharacterized protein n=1 Tax=Naganishia cerealis TaxID=610337 RepID=A0ACC2W375_9TREE|nr:hypothetical protein QFC19_003537 [Naganishia cerealis]